MMEIFNVFSGFKLPRLMRLGVFVLCFVLYLGVLVWFISLCLLCNLLERINEWLWEGLEKISLTRGK